jgi:PAS domain S-box-containing protein
LFESHLLEWAILTAAHMQTKTIRTYAALAVPTFLAIILGSHFFLTDVYLHTHVFEPPLLMPLLNVVFLGLSSLGVSFLAAKSYRKFGRPNLALLGSGALAFGLAGVSAGWFIGLPRGVNETVTIFSCGVLLAGLLYFSSSITDIFELPPEEDAGRRKRRLAVSYAAVLMASALVVTTTLSGWTPVFFVQQVGPTVICQFTFGAAIVLLFFSGVYLLSLYTKSSADFFFWYAFGLIFIAEGLLGEVLTRAVGGIINWTGRCALYMGGIYLLIAVFGIYRERSAEDVLSEVFKRPKELYLSIFENSLEGIILSIHEGPILSANPSACNMLGYEPAQIRRVTVNDIFSTQSTEFITFRNELAARAKTCAESTLIRRDGSHFPAAISSAVFKDSYGKMLEVLTFQDISERRLAVEALRESEQRWAVTLGSIGDAVIATDTDGLVTFLNKVAEVLTGWNVTEAVGQPVHKIFRIIDAHTRSAVEDPVKEVLQTGMIVGLADDTVLLRKGGGRVPIDDSGAPIRDERGRNLGVVIVFRDVTERKRTEEMLRRLNSTLEQRVAERTELAEARARQLQTLAVELVEAEEKERRRIAQLLHDDLQQILAAARFQLQAIERSPASDPLASNVERLLEEAISKSRRLSHELSPPVLNHAGLVDALHWLALQMEEQFGLQIDLQADSVQPSPSEAPKVFLFRAAQELLFNVVKHAGVKSARVELSGSTRNIVLIVSDRGRGFNPERLVSSGPHAGLGLVSLRERALSMGGGMDIESAPGRGSRFALMVPLTPRKTDLLLRNEAPAERPTRIAGGPTHPGRVPITRVLFADDHKVMRQGLISMIAGHLDIQVVGEAADGRQAVERTLQFRPDVVVMDISMPVMDGVEATRRIKAEQPDVRVIGLSMFEDEQIASSMRQAGAETMVSKTASSAELLKAIYGGARHAQDAPSTKT